MKTKILTLYSATIFGFLYIPILILIAFSFNQDKFNSEWTGFTIDWYYKMFQNKDLVIALKDSFIIAFFSALIATIIGTLFAYALRNIDKRINKYLVSFIFLPILTPDIVLGISILSFFVFIQFSIGFFSILIAHTTFNIAFVFIIVNGQISSLNKDIELAAFDLGASYIQTFWLIMVPNILPSILSAFLIAFTLSWDDFIISFFNSGGGVTTFPVKVYSMIKFGANPQINAISTITLLITLSLILLAEKIQNRTIFSPINSNKHEKN